MAADRTSSGREIASGRHCYSLRSAHSLSSPDQLLSNVSNESFGAIGEPVCGKANAASLLRQSPSGCIQSLNRQTHSKSFAQREEDLEGEEEEQEAATEATAGNRGKKRRKKFVGVRQRPSGRWVAEIKDTTQKIRLWLGTFDTAEDAARAYDEAACLLRGANTRTNFVPHASSKASPLASKVARMLHTRRHDFPSAMRAPQKSIQNTQPVSLQFERPRLASGYPPFVESLSSNSENEDDQDSTSLTVSSPSRSCISSVYTGTSAAFDVLPGNDRSSMCNDVTGNGVCIEPLGPSVQKRGMVSEAQFCFSESSVKATRSDVDFGKPSQQWMKDEVHQASGLINSLIEEYSIRTPEENWSDESLQLHQRGSYMDAVLGLNDDILGSTDMGLNYSIDSTYHSLFDFGSESSLCPMIDDFPLINELSGKLEEAEKTYGAASENSSEENSEAIKRMRFERRVSASLYALNGVHELLRQSQTTANNYSMASPPSTAASSFNFLNHCSSSPAHNLAVSPWKSATCDPSSSWKTNLHNTPTSGASTPVPTTINFPMVAENSDQQSQEAAMWSSWDLSPLCPLSVA